MMLNTPIQADSAPESIREIPTSIDGLNDAIQWLECQARTLLARLEPVLSAQVPCIDKGSRDQCSTDIGRRLDDLRQRVADVAGGIGDILHRLEI